MLEAFSSPDAWVALLTLTSLEIVLGIDNIVFIAILAAKLPEHQQRLAYNLGLGGALITRLGLLFAIAWIMRLETPLFTLLDNPMTGRELILLGGGIFLIGKSAHEIYEKVELPEEDPKDVRGRSSLVGTVVQIMLLDIIFSLDSVITAVGMVDAIEIMVIAIIVAVGVMLVFAKRIGDFVNRHPSMKILALSFLTLIGVLLTAEAFDQHISKGYIYAAMGFSLAVEVLNMRLRGKGKKASPTQEA
ncbi:MAG: TerC family protein [Myxococcales bacterium]|nr:TerC family protein [Myxococcales bacterium]